ncbi:MAG: putative beta-lysine N-acetyltransferase [Candidatus Glassbacteria bacterium]|nr:putative beta-lysine N-acetyltransferase [Candidatus Glassbacteria bacterium]
MYDKIVQIKNSIIQHGPLNDRIYLMKLGDGDAGYLVKELDSLSKEKGYSKITIKVPAEQKSVFEGCGYRLEASIPGFFNGKGDAAFLSKYLKKERQKETNPVKIKEILAIAEQKATQSNAVDDISPLVAGVVDLPDEVEQMSMVYKEVFETYPFPIHDPDYLRKTMASHVQYFYIRDGIRFVALSSAEMDPGCQSVEMTDFATLPPYRGKGLAAILLDKMETVMKRREMLTGYTIARAFSAGMNITFAKMGYIYAGTLTNNTNICGNIESMNIWYKKLNGKTTA